MCLVVIQAGALFIQFQLKVFYVEVIAVKNYDDHETTVWRNGMKVTRFELARGR